jgi:ribosome-associated heat shock protein Hsp15
MTRGQAAEQGEESMRLDKWLWAARFFKTRQLAVEAIQGGKVHCDGQRVKPGRALKLGSRLEIRKGPYLWEVIVEGLPSQRRPASEAAQNYRETPQSTEKREQLMEQLRLERLASPRQSETRPNKKQRRQIHRFVGK